MVAIVQRSLLLWLPGPSVTQLPLLESWQYALPLITTHMLGAAGGSGGGVGGGGKIGSGGGGVGGDGAAGGDGGLAAEAQMVKPP